MPKKLDNTGFDFDRLWEHRRRIPRSLVPAAKRRKRHR